MVRGFWPTVFLWLVVSTTLSHAFGYSAALEWVCILALPVIGVGVLLAYRAWDRVKARRRVP